MGKTSNVFGQKMQKLLEENEKKDKKEEKEAENEKKPVSNLISNPLEYFSKLSEEKEEASSNKFGNKMQGLLNEMGAAKQKKDFLNTVFEEQVDENDLPFFMSNHEEFFGVEGKKKKEEQEQEN